MTRPAPLILFALLLLALVACGGGGGGDTEATPWVLPTSPPPAAAVSGPSPTPSAYWVTRESTPYAPTPLVTPTP